MAEKEMHFLDFWTKDPEFFREKVPSFNIMIGSTRPDHEWIENDKYVNSCCRSSGNTWNNYTTSTKKIFHFFIGRVISEMQGTERANKVADKRCLQAPVVLPLTKSPKKKRGGANRTAGRGVYRSWRLCSASSSRIDTGPYHPRPDLMMAAHEIARDHFDVESGDANIAALKDFMRYLKKGEKLPFWDRDPSRSTFSLI